MYKDESLFNKYTENHAGNMGFRERKITIEKQKSISF